MSKILDEIVANKRIELEKSKAKLSLQDLQAYCDDKEPAMDFFEALNSSEPPAIIAECKKKSPSKGTFCDDYHPVNLANSYEAHGATAISVLTDEKYFGGSLTDLKDVSSQINLPVLRKDFILDEYQVYEARHYGASSFLLLAGVLDAVALQYLIEVGRELGMEALVESHNAKEFETALKTDAKILGINNRNLNTMQVDLNHSLGMIEKFSDAASERLLVCESGIRNRNDIDAGLTGGFRAFLIGELLVKSPDLAETLNVLRGHA